MKSVKVCEYSRSRSFHYDLILQDQASGERSQDQWSSGSIVIFCTKTYGWKAILLFSHILNAKKMLHPMGGLPLLRQDEHLSPT